MRQALLRSCVKRKHHYNWICMYNHVQNLCTWRSGVDRMASFEAPATQQTSFQGESSLVVVPCWSDGRANSFSSLLSLMLPTLMWHYLILIGVLWMFSEKQCCICQHGSILVSAGVFSLPRRFFPAEVTMNWLWSASDVLRLNGIRSCQANAWSVSVSEKAHLRHGHRARSVRAESPTSFRDR